MLDFVKSVNPFKVKVEERTLAEGEVPLLKETANMVVEPSSQTARLEGHPICSQAKGSKVEERLVHLRMEVKFEVLIKKKKMYYLGLRGFDLWMEFWMVHLIEGVGDEEVVVGEGFEEEAFAEFMVDFGEKG
ncbi:hypothetical protein Tco_1185216 [Tanacetum coccineum]